MLLLCTVIKNSFWNLRCSDRNCCCQVPCTLGRATQRKVTEEQLASAWVTGVVGSFTGCPPHI